MRPCPALGCRDTDGNAVLTDDPFCEYHTNRIRRALGDLPQLYDQLAAEIEQQTIRSPGGNDAKVTASRTAPVPLNLAARSLQDDMLVITRRAVIVYHSQRQQRITIRIRGYERNVLARQCAFLVGHLDGVLADNLQPGMDVLEVKHRATALLGLTPLIHPLPAPCPECDCMTLRREDGDSWVRCVACGITFDEDHYGVLVRVLASANPAHRSSRIPTRQRARCAAASLRSGLTCRVHENHLHSHLTYADGYTEWETWQ